MSASRLIFDDKYRVGEWVADQMADGADWHNYYAMGAETKGNIVSGIVFENMNCLLYTSPSPRDRTRSRMPSSA